MFFRGKKRRDEDDEAPGGGAADTVEGTMPEVAEAEPALGQDLAVGLAGASAVPAPVADDAVRLFPGFEHEDFEVGFRMGGPVPALVMRWKEGGDWFRLPPMFNRAVLASMDERDTGSDLTRLMRSFGYDVGEAR